MRAFCSGVRWRNQKNGLSAHVIQVNPEDAKQHKGIIANPNCSTIIMNVAVWPLHRAAKVKRVVCSTYQAASGAGAAAMEELEQQSRDWVSYVFGSSSVNAPQETFLS